MQTIARSAFDLQLVLDAVVDGAVRLCHGDSGNLALRDGDVFRARAFKSFSPEYQRISRDHVYAADRTTVIGRSVTTQDVVHIEDVAADPEYTAAHLRQAGGYRTALGVPMLRDGVALGALAIGRNEVRPFSDAEIGLLQTFADQVTVAIEQVRLYQTVERQRTELARFAPQVAALLSSDEGESLLAGHRREITALFSDLRGFTAFAETADPEEVLGVLRQYHTAVGQVAVANGGTVEHFAGDGMMVFFNDPVPDPDHAATAVGTGVQMRERFAPLAADWKRRGYVLGLGVGIATGYATLGRIGFEGRYDYAAIGNCVNLAARLSDVAGPGEILISQRVHAAIEGRAVVEPMPDVELKGFSKPIATFKVLRLAS